MLDQILAHFTSDSPRTVNQANIWTKAAQTNSEVRAMLPPVVEPAQGEGAPQPPRDPSYAFFPPEWSNILNEETVAELVVDAYTSAFADALLDGAVSLVDVSNKFSASQASLASLGSSATLGGTAASLGGTAASLGESKSEPTLQRPGVNRRLKNNDNVLLRMGLDDRGATSSEGFTMAGLSKDPWEAWNAQNYHKCKPLDPLVRRIEKATEAQRPQRRSISLTQRRRPADQRKYLWPMTATNFPEAWDKATSPPKAQSHAQMDWDSGDEPGGPWLLRLKDGKTTFPYSLVSHRAFLEAQPNAALKDKAKKLAPLNLTSSW
jgi:hypothetical protein